MANAETATYRVTVFETIAHTVDIKAITFRQAERIADRYWREDGPEAFTATTLGRSQASTSIEVHS